MPTGSPINCGDSELTCFISSLARGAGSSPTCSSGTGPSAPLNLQPKGKKCWRIGSKRGSSPGSRSSGTSGISTAGRGEGLLTASQEDSLVRMCRSLGGGWGFEPAAARVFGRSLPESLEKFGLVLRSSKIHRFSSPGGWMSFCQTLPNWGTMLDGVVWELGTSLHRTRGIGCGLWPTPGVTGFSNERQGRMLARKASGLGEAVAMADGRTSIIFPYFGEVDRGRHVKDGGRLNPEWVEWLMGWPVGWTGSGSLGTGKFQSWLRSHSRFLAGV